MNPLDPSYPPELEAELAAEAAAHRELTNRLGLAIRAEQAEAYQQWCRWEERVDAGEEWDRDGSLEEITKLDRGPVATPEAAPPRNSWNRPLLRLAAGLVMVLVFGAIAKALTPSAGPFLRDVWRGLLHQIGISAEPARKHGPDIVPTTESRAYTPVVPGRATQSPAGGTGLAAVATPETAVPYGPCVFAFTPSGLLFIIDPLEISLVPPPPYRQLPVSDIRQHTVALTKDGTRAILLDRNPDNPRLLTVDTATGAASSEMALDVRGEQLLLGPDERTAYVLQWVNVPPMPRVIIVALSTVPRVIRVIDLQPYEALELKSAPEPEGMVLDPSGTRLFVLVGRHVETGRSPLQVVDLDTGRSQEVQLPGDAIALYRLSGGPGQKNDRLLIGGIGTLLDFDTLSVVSETNLSDYWIASSDSRDELYVYDGISSKVRVFGLASMVEKPPAIDTGFLLSPLLVVNTRGGERLFAQAHSSLPADPGSILAVDLEKRKLLPERVHVYPGVAALALGERCPEPDLR